jgi:hypothetical protein
MTHRVPAAETPASGGAAAPGAPAPEAPPPDAATPDAVWARTTALEIWTRLAARDYAGWDPYDALNSRLIPAVLTKPRLVRRGLTQVVKRSPLPLQPLLAVKRQVDAYTLGHVLLAGARLQGGAAPAHLRATCEQVAARLRRMAVADGDSISWGYHFPVHTRFFSYVPPAPNLIVTAFVAKGMAAVTRAGLVDCSAELRGAVAFILAGLPRVRDEEGQCIGYVPGETAVVHNANMLAALVLCEAAEILGGGASTEQAASSQAAAPAGAAPPAAAVAPTDAATWIGEALACARFTAARQSADGSWPYSEEVNGRWVDGFHTGFVLDGLAAVVRTTGDEQLRAALLRGLRFYVAQLFGPDGAPKYYPDHALPYDALSAAQGVETLHVALSGGGPSQAVPGQIDWIRRHLVRPGGKVAYQVHRRWTDHREFPRWSSAPLMSALAGVGSQAASAAPFVAAAPAVGAVAAVAAAPSGEAGS